MIELVPETIKLGPVLPYDTKSIEAFEITNTMDTAIEIYSLDFDTQYLEEEENKREEVLGRGRGSEAQ